MPRVTRQKGRTQPDNPPTAKSKRSLRRVESPLQNDLTKIAQITYKKAAKKSEDEATEPSKSTPTISRRSRRTDVKVSKVEKEQQQQQQQTNTQPKKQRSKKSTEMPSPPSSQPSQRQQMDEVDTQNQQIIKHEQPSSVPKALRRGRSRKATTGESPEQQQINSAEMPPAPPQIQNEEFTKESNNGKEVDDQPIKEVTESLKRKTRAASLQESSNEAESDVVTHSKKRVAATPDIDDLSDGSRSSPKSRTNKRAKVAPRWHNQSYMLFLALRQHPERWLPRGELCKAAVEMDKKISDELNLPRVFVGKTPLNSASAKLTYNIDRYFVPFRPEGCKSMCFKLAYEPGDVKTAVEEYQKWWKKLIEHDWPYCFGIPKPDAVRKRAAETELKQQQQQQQLDEGSVSMPATDAIIGSGNEQHQNVDDKENKDEEDIAGKKDVSEPKANTAPSPKGIIKSAISLVQSGLALQGISFTTNLEQVVSPTETGNTTASESFNSTTHQGSTEEHHTELVEKPNGSTNSQSAPKDAQTLKGRTVDDVTNTLGSIEEKQMMSHIHEKTEDQKQHERGPERGNHQRTETSFTTNNVVDEHKDVTQSESMSIEKKKTKKVSFAKDSVDFENAEPPTTSIALSDLGSSTQTPIPDMTNATAASLSATTSMPNNRTKQPASDKEYDAEEAPIYTLDELDLTDIPTSWRDIVYVAPSKIPGAGKGLFAKRKLPYNTPIGFYFGVPMTEDEFDAIKDRVGRASHYSIMYRRIVLDATDDEGEPITDESSERFCPFHFMNETHEKNASILFVEGAVVNQVICWTKKEIEKDEELLVWYGSDISRHWHGDFTNGDSNETNSKEASSSSNNNAFLRQARTKKGSALKEG